MIRHIVAVDAENGIARDGVTPWELQGDMNYFRDNIKKFGSRVLVASKTHEVIGRPIANFTYVWSHRDFAVEKGKVVHDLQELFGSMEGDLWIIGGASLYEATIDVADELYITRVKATYGCDRFYPKDLTAFELSSRSQPIQEADTSYLYEIYSRKPTL